MRKAFPSFIFLFALIVASASSAATSNDILGFYSPFRSVDPNRWAISNGWANGDFQSCEWRSSAVSSLGGYMHMRLSENGGDKRPLGCAETHTKARLGFGLYEARMRTAKGSGLNTAFFTYIGPPNGVQEWDEIDFEFLGKDSTTVQLNYYTGGKGGHEKVIQLGFDASQGFHDYAFDWEPDKIKWYVDKKLVFETPDDAHIPVHPGMLFLSLWSGAPSFDGWLGHLDYKVPVTADVEWSAYTPATATSCLFPKSLKCK